MSTTKSATGQPLLARRLTGDARPGVGLVEAAEAHQPLDLHVDRHVDDDRGLQVVRGRSASSGMSITTMAIGADLCLHPLGRLDADRRVHDLVQRLHRLGIGEHLVGQRLTVERAVGR